MELGEIERRSKGNKNKTETDKTKKKKRKKERSISPYNIQNSILYQRFKAKRKHSNTTTTTLM